MVNFPPRRRIRYKIEQNPTRERYGKYRGQFTFSIINMATNGIEWNNVGSEAEAKRIIRRFHTDEEARYRFV